MQPASVAVESARTEEEGRMERQGSASLTIVAGDGQGIEELVR